MNKNVITFIGCDADYEEAELVIFGAPYDGTTSYRPGARFAGQAVRAESYGLETYSPYLDKDLSDRKIFDCGELDLPFGDPVPVLKIIHEHVKTILDDNKKPVMIGGEHLVTLGAFRAALDKYPDMCLVHFDAHADLRYDYLGTKLSHACVIRRCHELAGDGRIFQYGIRSGERDEFIFAEHHTRLQKFDFRGLEKLADIIGRRPVYFTIDLDVLDSGVFPATGTPEAGGIAFTELLSGIRTVCGLNIVAADINELSPPYDSSGASTALACKVLRELLLQL